MLTIANETFQFYTIAIACNFLDIDFFKLYLNRGTYFAKVEIA